MTTWQCRIVRCLVPRTCAGDKNLPSVMWMDATHPSSSNASTRRGGRTAAAAVVHVAADDGAAFEIRARHKVAGARLASCTPQHVSCCQDATRARRVRCRATETATTLPRCKRQHCEQYWRNDARSRKALCAGGPQPRVSEQQVGHSWLVTWWVSKWRQSSSVWR